MLLVNVPQCPLCGGEKSIFYDRCDDTLLVEINRYLPGNVPELPQIKNTRRCCLCCGLVYLSPRLDNASLSKVYELWYRFAYQRLFDDQRHIADRKREFRKYHLAALNKAIPHKGRLLDIGCGNGLFLSLAEKSGWEGVGVEFDPYTAESGRKMLGLSIRTGTMQETLSNGERFHAITLFDYLEHSTSPGDDLDFLVKFLEPGGVLLVRVPNLDGWQSKLMGCSWLSVISNHISYFNASVLKPTLEARGLRVEYMQAKNFNSEFDIIRQRWQWLNKRLRQRRSQNQKSSALQSFPRPIESGNSRISKLLYSLFVEQVDHIGGWFGRGNNLLVEARKPQ